MYWNEMLEFGRNITTKWKFYFKIKYYFAFWFIRSCEKFGSFLQSKAPWDNTIMSQPCRQLKNIKEKFKNKLIDLLKYNVKNKKN